MLKKCLLVLIVTALFFPAMALADDQESKGTPVLYQAEVVYPGIYKGHRLYQFVEQRQTWFANPRPKTWAQLPCAVARKALTEQGEWVGILTENGECAGYAEAPRLAAGNYLNYLRSSAAKGDK